MTRAVIFDLWDTLVDWPVAEGERLKRMLSDHLGVGGEEFERRWNASYRAQQTGPLDRAYRSLGLAERHVAHHVEARHAAVGRALRLRDGAADAIAELRRRGLGIGVITVCSEEVPAAWPGSDLAGLFDAETFSVECGLMKPEPEIYRRTAAALGVEPEACLFVGDGANDELAGAARVGMTPVLFAPEGREPLWREAREWAGLRVASLRQVPGLC